MRVIGAGFGRTGTTSTKAALELLGLGPVHHMSEVKANPPQIHAWLRVARHGDQGLDAALTDALAGYQSCLDWPGAAYWRELAGCYPDAKVLLTVRDTEQWLDSMEQTIFRNVSRRRGLMWHLRPVLNSLHNRDHGAFLRMTRKVILDRVFDGEAYDRARIREVYERHTAEVVAAIPASRLLVYDVAQGWETLCAFLDVPVPDEPFPRLNDRKGYHSPNHEFGHRLLRRS
ncbi:sulfotransferase family protein [Actinoplanes auranticolor]|uniref:Sulfotransferase family protein n=1 Tax=Actinoplanes auranticolor TaxID=47988 RepID=A0A919SX88_9ACTN|nr:sulfotransferase family protein [Actinoplanes auranticolor]GIM80167.1 sulfotransferase family protein [Actinoplanes auranticolor]